MPTWDPTLFGNGKIACAAQDPLLLTVVKDTLADAEWLDYLDGALARQGVGGTKISAIRFVKASINATQRSQTREHVKRTNTPAPLCNAVFVENELIRGAMIAFGFLMRSWTLKPYAAKEYDDAFTMLRGVLPFDHAAAVAKWKLLHTMLGLEIP